MTMSALCPKSQCRPCLPRLSLRLEVSARRLQPPQHPDVRFRQADFPFQQGAVRSRQGRATIHQSSRSATKCHSTLVNRSLIGASIANRPPKKSPAGAGLKEKCARRTLPRYTPGVIAGGLGGYDAGLPLPAPCYAVRWRLPRGAPPWLRYTRSIFSTS